MKDLSTELLLRCEFKCELCNATEGLSAYNVPPKPGSTIDQQVVICSTCKHQLALSDNFDLNHWRCLNESIWSAVPSVQVVSFRMLNKLSNQTWAQDLLTMIDLDADTLEWAEDAFNPAVDLHPVHKDSNGTVLMQGDTVVLIQDLNVKGANFVAKRGTSIKRITLVNDNPEHIEGRVNDQHIVILTKYVKKSN
jgi:protein PhnA